MKIRDRKQSGHIYRRGRWWVLRYRIEVSVGGKVRVIQRAKRLIPVDAAHKTKASVRLLVEEALRPINEQTCSPETITTLGDFAERIYLPYTKDQKRASTYQDYRNRWKEYLAGRCGGWWLREVRTCDVQQLMQEIAREHDIGRRTLAHIKALVSGVFTFAKQMGYYDGVNPAVGAGIPKARPAGETHAYTLEQVIQIVTALPQPSATITAVAAFTGLRRGEIEGLLWENYTGKEIRVTRSVWNGVADEPKTSKSRAPVPVITPLRRMLDAYSASCGHPVSGAMFAGKVGKPLCLNNLTNREIQPRFEYCKSCGQIRFGHGKEHPFQLDQTRILWRGWHGFRRGLASNLYRLGVSDKTIQAILRHANLSTTMNVYVKTVDADSVKAMKALEDAIVRLIVRRHPTRLRLGRVKR